MFISKPWSSALRIAVFLVAGAWYALASAQSGRANYTIGVYYYPGWKTDTNVQPPREPWQQIKAFPEREPLLGWYNEGEVDVMEQHLKWMHDYGIGVVVFDWYWTNLRARNEHALAAYLKAKNKPLVQFSLLWANHEASPKSQDDFAAMVRYWARYYFKDPQYQRINNLPVVHIFDPNGLEKKANVFGSSSAALISQANAIARESGFAGIYFVGGTPASAFAQSAAEPAGYQALSAYNYSAGRSGGTFHSYAALDRGYQQHWEWLLQNAPLPYMPAMSSGWDRRAWGGSKDPLRDLSVSTPDLFEAHLRAAKELMDKSPEKTLRMGVICCWNEFGEGSYIEPTKRFQLEYLERVKKVFGRKD